MTKPTLTTEHWMASYEAAYRAANGSDAKVVICGGGWYRISAREVVSTGIRFRKASIVEMTARLEKRAMDESRQQA